MSVDRGRNQPTGNPNCADGQVMLDIEVTGAVSPAANIVVYFAPNTNAGFTDAIAAAVHDETNKPSVISISWGGPESTWAQPGQHSTRCSGKRQCRGSLSSPSPVTMALPTVVQDGRAHVDFPSSSPWALSVGGTSLVADGNTIASETASNSGANGGTTGGGVSDVFAQPDW